MEIAGLDGGAERLPIGLNDRDLRFTVLPDQDESKRAGDQDRGNRRGKFLPFARDNPDFAALDSSFQLLLQPFTGGDQARDHKPPRRDAVVMGRRIFKDAVSSSRGGWESVPSGAEGAAGLNTCNW